MNNCDTDISGDCPATGLNLTKLQGSSCSCGATTNCSRHRVAAFCVRHSGFGAPRQRRATVIREPSYGDCTQWQARFIPFDQAFLDPARVYLRLDSRRYRSAFSARTSHQSLVTFLCFCVLE